MRKIQTPLRKIKRFEKISHGLETILNDLEKISIGKISNIEKMSDRLEKISNDLGKI